MQASKKQAAQLDTWAGDAAIFNTLLYAQPSVTTTAWQHELEIANTNNPINITMACNLYCSPCANAHKKIEELIKQYPNSFSVQVRFTIQAKENTAMATKAAKLILQQTHRKTAAETNTVLSDWFANMNEDKFKEKYSSQEDTDVQQTLQQNEDWCTNAAIAFTPTFFINGYQMPGQYTVDDLMKLLPKLQNKANKDGTNT